MRLTIQNIPFQSYCWVIGTTSFRTAKLNLKIEEQLLLLSEFYETFVQEEGNWKWDKASQIQYYDFMRDREFLTGDASRKDKDAREKTSGLVDIGLIYNDRTITEAGFELLNIAKDGNFKEENHFNIEKDSYVYFKQLLKTSIKVGSLDVRPYYVLAKLLTELEYLTFQEFMYLLPLAIDESSTESIIEQIKQQRSEDTPFEDIIFDTLMSKENYQLAYETFKSEVLSEDLVCLIGMNRKSRNYDRPYYQLLLEIIEVFHEGNEDRVYDLFLAARKINQRPGVSWRNLLFRTTLSRSVRKNGADSLKENCIFKDCESIDEIKDVFFKYMHVFKAMATLEDYFDLNRRYFNLTETLVFEDETVRFDIIPNYFFKDCMDLIYPEAFSINGFLNDSIEMDEISAGLVFDEGSIYEKISEELGVTISTPIEAATFIKDERYGRFNKLIDDKFSNDTLIELLNYFEVRNDAKIEEIVTDEADIPTIFEYILAIIWYKISERKGDILDYMKLSLEANLLPRSHAAGGSADIVYEYEQSEHYPKHSLLIEATLSDGSNQRRMEMEPVSRHLGEHRIKSENPYDYSLFISTFLHRNVVSDFRYRKHMPYFGNQDECIEGMKIMSMDTEALKEVLRNEKTYKDIYEIFEKYHQSELQMPLWHEELMKEITEPISTETTDM